MMNNYSFLITYRRDTLNIQSSDIISTKEKKTAKTHQNYIPLHSKYIIFSFSILISDVSIPISTQLF